MKKLDSQYGSDGGGSIHPILMGQAETVWERWRKSEPLLHQSVSYIRNLKNHINHLLQTLANLLYTSLTPDILWIMTRNAQLQRLIKAS